MIAELRLSGGFVTIVDADDYSAVKGFNWRLRHDRSGAVYAECSINGRTTSLHRFLLGRPNGVLIDHANGNGLDNRRANLRLANHSQNAINSGSRKGCFKGVSPTRYGTFRAVIHKNYQQIRLGTFKTEEEAARAYDAAAAELFGEFARLNFPNARAPAPLVARKLPAANHRSGQPG